MMCFLCTDCSVMRSRQQGASSTSPNSQFGWHLACFGACSKNALRWFRRDICHAHHVSCIQNGTTVYQGLSFQSIGPLSQFWPVISETQVYACYQMHLPWLSPSVKW